MSRLPRIKWIWREDIRKMQQIWVGPDGRALDEDDVDVDVSDLTPVPSPDMDAAISRCS